MDQRRIVELTFGEVGSLGPVLRRPKDVALSLGVRYNTVLLQLRNYRRRGGRLPEPLPPRPPNRPSKFTAELKAFLLDNETLKAWRGWSLGKRLQQVEQRFGIALSPNALSHFYRRNGIRKMLAPFRWHTPTTDEERDAERREWVVQLVQHLMDGREVVYVDETSVSVWDRRVRTWMYRDNPIPHTLAKDRGHSITVLGAISTKRDGLEYCFSHSTNAQAVVQLMKRVFRRAHDPEEVVVVWDNHSSHRTSIVRELIASSGACLLPLPVNSSDLNPIERVWAQLKPKWHHALYTYPGDLDPDEARDLLDRVLQEQVVPRTNNYAHGNRDIMLRALLNAPMMAVVPAERASSSAERVQGVGIAPQRTTRRSDPGGWKPH